MGGTRRGYDPTDCRFFGSSYEEKMCSAAFDCRWLLNRGYGMDQTITFVGNHYMLAKRQRMALYRSVMSDEERQLHAEKEVTQLRGPVYVDGFNMIISLEVALSGGLMLLGDDGALRDLAGLHGTYRIIDQTRRAVELLKEEILQNPEVSEIVFYLDRPVSNSGRLKLLVEEVFREEAGTAAESGAADEPAVRVELADSPDALLRGKGNVLSADSIVQSESACWYGAVRKIVERRLPEAWVYRFGARNH